MEHVFCTVLSRYRVYQALALLWSLRQVGMSQRFFVLCMDEDTLRLFKKMRAVNVVPVDCRILKHAQLDSLEKTRRLNEYCWTLKPVFIEWLLKENPEIGRVTYLDADLFFYSDPSAVFEKHQNASVMLTRGEIAVPMMSLRSKRAFQEMMGEYNSGFISFLRDETGFSSLSWWKKKCMGSCLSQPQPGQFGDQKYLDEVPFLFRNVEEITAPGFNIGHWNCDKHRFSVHDGYLYMDQYRLICYHFSGFRILSGNRIYRVFEANRPGRPFFYEDYTSVLQNLIEKVANIDPDFNGCSDDEEG